MGLIRTDYQKVYQQEKVWQKHINITVGNHMRNYCLQKLLPKTENKTYHDIGCGHAGTLDYVKNIRKYQISGSDITTNHLELKTINKYNIQQIDIESQVLPIQCDIITCLEVLEHIWNDKQAIENLYKSLNKDGILIVSVPANMKNWNIEDIQAHHIRRYDLEQLKQKLQTYFNINKIMFAGGLLTKAYITLNRQKLQKNKQTTQIRANNRKQIKNQIISKLLLWDITNINKKNCTQYYIKMTKK